MYYLEKELGLSHADIFGGKKVIWRDGRAEEVTTTGMDVFTFLAYIELMEMDAEEREQERERIEQQQSMNKSKM